MSDKKHLDFNLDFLDKESSKGRGVKKKNRVKLTNESDQNWVIPLGVIIVIFIFFIVIFSSGDTTDTNQTKNYSNAGEYECSQYHDDRSEELIPSESEEQYLLSEKARLDREYDALEQLSDKIESLDYYLTEYSSQYEIDSYNILIEEYNLELEAYTWDADLFDARINNYNIQADAYDNYLIQNCNIIK